MKVDKEAFDRDGYTAIRGLYSEREAAEWKKDVVRRMNEGGHINNPDGVHVWWSEGLESLELERMCEGPIVDVLTQLIGDHVEFLSVKAVFKNSNMKFRSPWHQDWHYWGGRVHKVSIWIALDDATPENGCLQVMPGSHKQILDMRGGARKDGPGFLHTAHDDDLPELPVVTLEAKRGDAVFFHDLLMHSSHPNTSGKDRWAFISTYRNASIKDTTDLWKTSVVVSGETVNT